MSFLSVVYGPSSVGGEGIEIYNAFDEHGLVHEEVLQDLFEDICRGQVTTLGQGSIGYFADGSQLQRFCFLLCQKLSHRGVNILTSSQFNEALAASHNTDELVEKLKTNGDFIENVDAAKKGFFDSLFSGLKG